jgi:hypothetical protein
MNNLLYTIAVMMVVFIAGCKKDDYVPIIGDCPHVLSTNPENNATGVPLNQVVRVNFNTRINPGTINQETITLQGANLVAGTVTYTDSTASFTPNNLLAPNTTYTGTVTTKVKDVTGNAMQQNYVWTFVTGPSGIEFNSLNRFGIFASNGISNLGNSQILSMDIGVSNANRSSITGFPPGEVIDGGIFAIDDAFPVGVPAMLAQAKVDFVNSYQNGLGMNSPSKVLISGDQGGRTLTPGIYQANNNIIVQSGHLTLDARGDSNAVWIFQVAQNFSTQGGPGGNIVLVNGAQAKNIYWIIGDSVTIGSGTSFNGNVLATNAIALNLGANLKGRLFSQNGSVSLSTNIINKP